MKIAVVTANIGNFDPIYGMPKQATKHEVTYHYYTEHNLPFPLTNLSQRMKARYLKSQSHRFLDADIHIWIDGRVKIQGNNFVQSFVDQLEDHDIAIYRHRDRKTVYQEMQFISSEIAKGNKNILQRYGDQQLVREAVFYKEEGLPDSYPLFTSGFFARRNSPGVNDCFDEWWQRLTEFSYSDQTMLSLVAWEHDLKVNALVWDEARTHKILTVESHA